jgi:hypothetical protein
MSANVEESVAPTSLSVWAELRAIWVSAAGIFFRRFSFLEAELAAATWRRFFLTMTMAIVLKASAYILGFTLFYTWIYSHTSRRSFNMFAYWFVETLWNIARTTVTNIPLLLLIAYLSYHWVQHTKEERSHWIQEAQMLAITWLVPTLWLEMVYLFGYLAMYILFHDMTTLAVRTAMQDRYASMLSYMFLGLLTAPLVAYLYNLRLHGNSILNGLTGRNRWLLLGTQLVILEGGSFVISRIITNTPAIEFFRLSLSRFWR